jgi:hypothetical protein
VGKEERESRVELEKTKLKKEEEELASPLGLPSSRVLPSLSRRVRDFDNVGIAVTCSEGL